MRTLLDKLYEAYFWLSIAAYVFGLWWEDKGTHCPGCGARLTAADHDYCQSCLAW